MYLSMLSSFRLRRDINVIALAVLEPNARNPG
jgi:hypothetical protein